MLNKPPPSVPASHMATDSNQVLAAPLLIQLSGVVWKSRRWLKPLGLCTHVRDPEEAAGYWFRIGPAQAIMAIWGVNQWMENLSISPFLPPTPLSALQK